MGATAGSRAAKGALASALIAAVCLFGSGAEAADKVRIGLLKLSSAAPLYLAKERGYFEQDGIEADFKFFDAAVPIAVAAVSGDIDIGFTGFTAAFYNLAEIGRAHV